MKGKFLSFVIGGLLGFVVGNGFMIVIFPFLFMNDAANDSLSQADVSNLLVETIFRNEVEGQDSVHWGKGGLKVYEGVGGDIVLELQSDFEVGPGPNFWIYANTTADINTEKDFLKDSSRKKLLKLRNFRGAQVYKISANDYKNAKAITIWCESFKQYIASANL